MEDFNILNGLILAAITAAVCAAGFIAGTKKRVTGDPKSTRQLTAGDHE